MREKQGSKRRQRGDVSKRKRKRKYKRRKVRRNRKIKKNKYRNKGEGEKSNKRKGEREKGMLFWNCAEIWNKHIDFWRYVKSFISLCETWVEEKDWDRLKGKLPRIIYGNSIFKV